MSNSEPLEIVAESGRFRMRRCAPSDLVQVGENLRPTDQFDIAVTTASPPAELIRDALSRSPNVYAFDFDQQCVAVGGVRDFKTIPASAVWMVGTTGLDRGLRLGASRLCKPWLSKMVGLRPCVFNVIPLASTNTLRWLRWLGFREFHLHRNYNSLGHDCVEMRLYHSDGAPLPLQR